MPKRNRQRDRRRKPSNIDHLIIRVASTVFLILMLLKQLWAELRDW
jgi:hypothetical protein